MNTNYIKSKILEKCGLPVDLCIDSTCRLSDLYILKRSIDNGTTFKDEYFNDYKTLWSDGMTHSQLSVMFLMVGCEKLFNVIINDDEIPGCIESLARLIMNKMNNHIKIDDSITIYITGE